MPVGDHSEPDGVPRDVPGADQQDVVGDQCELLKLTIENRAFTDDERGLVGPHRTRFARPPARIAAVAIPRSCYL